MKNLILNSTLFLLIFSLFSCNPKKYNKCCYFTYTYVETYWDNSIHGYNSDTTSSKHGGCVVKQTKKELQAFEDDNGVKDSYNNAKNDSRYSNLNYYCK